VDYLLNRGAVLVGEATLSLAQVDLAYVAVNLLVSAVETLPPEEPGLLPSRHPQAGAPNARRGTNQPTTALSGSLPSIARSSGSLARTMPSWDPRWHAAQAVPGSLAGTVSAPGEAEAASPGVEQGLAQLVLTLIELLRQVMERQALRRVEGGSLDEEQIERIGVALMELNAKMDELCTLFEIQRDELNVDLGPLGSLLS
jgi:hypothetical protein